MIECRKRRKDEVDEEKDGGRGVVGREGEKERKKKSEHILREINKALSFTTLIHYSDSLFVFVEMCLDHEKSWGCCCSEGAWSMVTWT